MREIKFRRWDALSDEMLYGVDIENDTLRQLDGDNDQVYLQYTGLTDKNGKEIYANSDIFKFKYLKELHNPIDLTGIFTFNHDDLRYEIDIIGNKEYTCLCYVGNGIFYDFEIIGTKQENPELLGE